jgi:hypothetical protein
MPENYLDGLARAVDNFTRGQTAVTVDRVQRERQLADDARRRELSLQDIADNRDYADKSADKASLRRQKEADEDARMRFAMVNSGKFETTDSEGKLLSWDKLNRNKAEYEKGNAIKIQKLYKNQLAENDAKIDEIQKSLKDQAFTVDPQVSKLALKKMLDDPSITNLLGKGQITRLNQALNGADAEKAVRAVMGDFFWKKNAETMWTAFSTQVNAISDSKHQLDVATGLGELQKLYAVNQDLTKAQNSHAIELAGFLPDDMLAPAKKAETPKAAPLTDPNTVFEDLAKPAPKLGAKQVVGPASASAGSLTSESSPTPSIDDAGLVGVAGHYVSTPSWSRLNNPTLTTIPALGDALGAIPPLLFGKSAPGQLSPQGAPVGGDSVWAAA